MRSKPNRFNIYESAMATKNNKSQISNIKQITITKIQNHKRFGHWDLEFEIYL
jgi:hypothetical protein